MNGQYIPAINTDNLDAFARGVRRFTTGIDEAGYQAALDWARAEVTARSVPLLRLNDLPRGSFCSLSIVGSAAALSELLPEGNEALRAIRTLERWVGTEFQGIVPLNCSGENPLISAAAAAASGKPLVDGDGCGRVLPLLEQTTFTLHGISVGPIAVATPMRDDLILDAPATRIEELIRPIVAAAGGWAIVACYPMSAEQLAMAGLPGTLSNALRSGHPDFGPDPLVSRTLCRGTISGIEYPIQSIAGQPRSSAAGTLPSAPVSILISESAEPRSHLRLEAHNEIFLALADGRVIASAPDQILILNPRTHEVINLENLTVGEPVHVAMVPAASPAWKTKQGRLLMQLSGHAVEGFYNLSEDTMNEGAP
ncbi:DUF917 domain-containing protein [Arthrobacter sp. AZCC_0090]|uniref:DUF917 domain-containing protein n=1 Tax=Arthrobacter sp. AZCC_0090 TaxID=2735881 RepID=UPI0016174DFE|nr:DUF917 domain-containing protein [Arthrobacter sp. AZCC_0090]MBB6405993.1 hypothetical protein [Arthrobacter sp. AZCC_0090]